MVTQEERLVYTVREAAKLLGVSHVTLFRDIDSGKFTQFIRIGKRVVVPKAALEKLLTNAGCQPAK